MTVDARTHVDEDAVAEGPGDPHGLQVADALVQRGRAAHVVLSRQGYLPAKTGENDDHAVIKGNNADEWRTHLRPLR